MKTPAHICSSRSLAAHTTQQRCHTLTHTGTTHPWTQHTHTQGANVPHMAMPKPNFAIILQRMAVASPSCNSHCHTEPFKSSMPNEAAEKRHSNHISNHPTLFFVFRCIHCFHMKHLHALAMPIVQHQTQARPKPITHRTASQPR